MTDEELLVKSIHEPNIFEQIVDRYQEAFLKKSQSILKIREDAEDCVQETFVKIYLNAAKFKPQPGATFKSWGYRILVNTTLTRLAKLKRVRGEELALDEEIMEILPDYSFQPDGIKDQVTLILARLPDHLARALRLHFVEGWSQKEIAEEEGITVSAIKTRVHRAKKEFKKINDAIEI